MLGLASKDPQAANTSIFRPLFFDRFYSYQASSFKATLLVWSAGKVDGQILRLSLSILRGGFLYVQWYVP